MEDGERITFTFRDYDTSSPNNTSSAADYVQSFGFSLEKFTGSGNNPTVGISVVYSDGSSHVFNAFSVPNTVSSYDVLVDTRGLSVGGTLVQALPTDAAGIHSIEILDVVDRSQTFVINGVRIGAISEVVPDLNPEFQLVIQDADGDVSSLSIRMNMDGNDPGGPTEVQVAAAPIVIDMNRDGQIEYIDLTASRATFDFGGDGYAERTAWVGPSDGLLVFDPNADRAVTDASQLAFVMYYSLATTDLEGLRFAFDSNGDGVFDANDSLFHQFGVWIDANGDGRSDPGEFQYLWEVGIESIGLYGSGYPMEAANGDVVINANITVTWSDGSIGLAQDVAFMTLGQPAEELAMVIPSEVMPGEFMALEAVVVDPDAVAFDLGAFSDPGDETDGSMAIDVDTDVDAGVDADLDVAHAVDALLEAEDVDGLVSTFLEEMHQAGLDDGDSFLTSSELAYGIDEQVSNFIELHGLSVEDHAAIQQDVFNALASDLVDAGVDDLFVLEGADSDGAIDASALMTSLETHFDEVYELHQADPLIDLEEPPAVDPFGPEATLV